MNLTHRPRRLRRTAAIRSLVRETRLSPDNFLYPLFAVPGEGQRREVGSMPGVFQLSVGNSAALGAALRAAHAHLRERDRTTEWDDVVAGLAEPMAASRVDPDPDRHGLYREMMAVYAACEAHALGRGPDPREQLERFAQSRPRDAARA